MKDSKKTFDPNQVQEDFPILGQSVRGKRLVYLDSAGSAQKPAQVTVSYTHLTLPTTGSV